MGRRARGRPPKGGEIPAEQWLDAARDVLDEGGLHGFSLSQVARRVNATVMALYRHFENRQTLLDAVLDRELESLHPQVHSDPHTRILHEIWAARRAVQGHPWLVPLLVGGGAGRVPALNFADRVVAALLEAQLSPVQAHAAWQLLLATVLASSASAPPSSSPPPIAGWPHLATVVAAVHAESVDDERMFRDFVAAILAGVASLPSAR